MLSLANLKKKKAPKGAKANKDKDDEPSGNSQLRALEAHMLKLSKQGKGKSYHMSSHILALHHNTPQIAASQNLKNLYCFKLCVINTAGHVFLPGPKTPWPGPLIHYLREIPDDDQPNPITTSASVHPYRPPQKSQAQVHLLELSHSHNISTTTVATYHLIHTIDYSVADQCPKPKTHHTGNLPPHLHGTVNR